MKKLVIFICLLFGFMLAFADTLDDVISQYLGYGSKIQHEGNTVFMASPYFDDEYVSEDNAYDFIANTVYLFMIVQDDWQDLENSSDESYINSIDEVAAPWANDYQTYIVSITVQEIIDNFGDDYDMDEEELIDEIRAYVEYHADHSPTSMY